MSHRPLEDEVEEQRVVSVDLVQRTALLLRDETGVPEIGGSCQKVYTRQRVVASVKEARVQVTPLKERAQSPVGVREKSQGRGLAEEKALVARVVHEAQEEIEARGQGSTAAVDILVATAPRCVQGNDSKAEIERTPRSG